MKGDLMDDDAEKTRNLNGNISTTACSPTGDRVPNAADNIRDKAREVSPKVWQCPVKTKRRRRVKLENGSIENHHCTNDYRAHAYQG